MDPAILHDSLRNIDTFELCRQIKKNPLNRLTLVALVNPSPDQLDVEREREAGAMDIWATRPIALGRSGAHPDSLAPHEIYG